MRFPSYRRIAAILGALALPLVAGACQMDSHLADVLNVGGSSTATENVAAGLPDAEVYCYQSPGAPASPVYWPDETQWWVIRSSIVTEAGGCAQAIAKATSIECTAPQGPGEIMCRVLGINSLTRPT